MGVPITVRLRGEADLAFLRRICPLMAKAEIVFLPNSVPNEL